MVREVTAGGDAQGWRVELLSDAAPLRKPFVQDTHEFGSLEDTVRWLDGAVAVEDALQEARS